MQGGTKAISRYLADPRLLKEKPAAAVRPANNLTKSETRVDIALLICALFLQRFIFHFGGKTAPLTIVPAAVILIHQFFAGKILIQYDRLLWFLLLALAATASLLLNFNKSSLTSYGLFLAVYLMFALRHPSTSEQYQNTLQGFQTLVLILSCLGIFQYLSKDIMDPGRLVMFFGIFPSSLLPYMQTGVVSGQKVNGIFLSEASTMSQITALSILIEILVFRRPRYLIVLSIGFLLAYGGTGLSILLLCLPLAIVLNRKAQQPVLLISLFALAAFATGIIHLSTFASRLGEFQDTGASGFIRFVSPFWMAAEYLDTASLSGFFFGNGSGHVLEPRRGFYSYTASADTWFNLLYEYGLLGAFVFTCFLGCCFRSTRCPTVLTVGLAFHYLFTGNNLFDGSYLIIVVVLCTLSGPERDVAAPTNLTHLGSLPPRRRQNKYMEGGELATPR
jgi:hypothetical protein